MQFWKQSRAITCNQRFKQQFSNVVSNQAKQIRFFGMTPTAIMAAATAFVQNFPQSQGL